MLQLSQSLRCWGSDSLWSFESHPPQAKTKMNVLLIHHLKHKFDIYLELSPLDDV